MSGEANQALELDELKALCAEATPGPWYAGSCWVYSSPVYDDDKRLSNVLGMSFSDPERQAEEWNRALRNVAFIAAARSAVPALLDEVERLTGERDRARQELALKDEALDQIRALHWENPGSIDICVDCHGSWPCDTQRVLSSLASRLEDQQ